MSENQKWVNKSLDATNGMRRAKAPEDLFSKIQHQLPFNNGKIISLTQIRLVTAIAAILLLVNVVLGSIYFQNKTNDSNSEQSIHSSDTNGNLISDYNIYE